MERRVAVLSKKGKNFFTYCDVISLEEIMVLPLKNTSSVNIFEIFKEEGDLYGKPITPKTFNITVKRAKKWIAFKNKSCIKTEKEKKMYVTHIDSDVI